MDSSSVPYVNGKVHRKKYNLLVVRVSDDKLVDSTPCMICINMMKKYNVKRVYFSTENGTIDSINVPECENDTSHMSHGLKLTIQNMSYINQVIIIGRVIRDKVS